MSDSEALKVVKTMAENGIKGNWDVVRQYVSDDLVMHVPAGLPFGRDYHGWDDYIQFFKTFAGYFTDMKASEQEFASFANKVVVMSRLSGRVAKTGKPISFPITAIWEVKDGKVVDIVPFYYDTKAISDLLSE
jgi:ketosteroid isomerase-like protein